MNGVSAPGHRRLLGALAAGVLLATLSGPGAGIAAERATRAAGGTTGKTYTVTLLTGDVVTVRDNSSGCPQVSVRPAAASGVLSRSCGPDGHVRVVPARVAPLLGDVLDPALFDVTALIRDGYDDARAKELPLIVRPGGAQHRLTADALVAGLTQTRALPSIDAVAGRAPKGKSAGLLRSLSSRSATLRATGPSPKVWLDRKVRATYASGTDANLRQIAAPQAWRAGYTGRGARVAVLDTGVDATHPDLAGRIAETKDFTVDGGDAVDHFGHGTHVAATIAGTGAASGGARRGVAPEAQLVIGKVLDDEGGGTDSQLIAGMEWAASRAPVVNLSLGGWEPSDGTDPASVALDALSEQTGALFVVAAGNSGPLDGSVSWPGAATRALTVGAVDGDDAVADFSSRGPLAGTRAAKPELVAPGVDIVAARAAGTSMGRVIDARYVAASGTSMATPHVAGAAAVLAQRHPGWRADQLKAALVGAADPVAGDDPYTNGTGRLNVARPLSGVVSATPVVGLGTLAFPQSGMAETKLSWVNTGSRPTGAALELRVTDRHGTAVAAGAVSLSARSVRLDPGGSGGVMLSVDRAAFAARPGLYTAVVTARNGRTAGARTLVTFYVEPPSYDLTIETTAIPGTPEEAIVSVGVGVVNIDDPALYRDYVGGDPGDTLTVRVPAGRYSVLGSSMAWADSDERMGLAGDPDVRVSGDTTVRLDLSRARRLTASVDGVATEAVSAGLTYVQMPRRGVGWTDFAFAWGDAARDGNVFVAPIGGAGIGTFQAFGSFGLVAPGNGPSPYLYDLIHPYGNGVPADPAYRVTDAEKAALIRIDQRFHRLDTPDSETGHKRYGFGPEGVYLAETATTGLSGDRTDYLSPGFAWKDEAFWNGIVTQEATARYEPGSRHEKVWVRQPLRSDWYDDPDGSTSFCEPAAPARTRGNLHVDMVTLTDQHGRFDCLGGDPWPLDLGRTLKLERDGRTVGEVPGSAASFAVDPRAADYRLTYDVDTTPAGLTVSTRVTTAWTFRSAGPRGTGSSPLPLLSVDYALPLDAANHPGPGPATFTVRQAHGVPRQAVTAFTLAVSLDSGRTWQTVRVQPAGAAGYRAELPQPAAGGTVSLRVTAQGDAGSGIEQTVIDAYRPA
ncbi:S8 family serine peptidase [Actinoplanes regularis]|uniref:S8 family serine peptidase n=1 Tax=Actinoplanes regularis TaxID=52697 RepID=UPI002556E11E|nr:S8 family serine peptidase [Actinoplanes regularis]